METAANIITTATKHAIKAETTEALADKIAETAGAIDRDGYLSIVSSWKQGYASTVAAIRKAKVERKGDVLGYAQSRREGLRVEARNLMAVRMALKELARRHRATTAPAAA
jgi:hypothetical protein